MKEKNINELTDEELEQASGGAGEHGDFIKIRVQCCECGYTWETTPRIMYVCKKCRSTSVKDCPR